MTLKSPLQHHSSEASILWCSDFFIVHFSFPYMTTGKTIALTIFVGKAMSLLFNMLSRFVIALTFLLLFLLFLYSDFDFFIFIPIPCFAKYLPPIRPVSRIMLLSLFAILQTI